MRTDLAEQRVYASLPHHLRLKWIALRHAWARLPADAHECMIIARARAFERMANNEEPET